MPSRQRPQCGAASPRLESKSQVSRVKPGRSAKAIATRSRPRPSSESSSSACSTRLTASCSMNQCSDRRWTHRGPARGPAGHRRRRRDRELRGRDARRPLDPRRAGVRPDQRAGHAHPGRGGPPSRGPLRPGLHRRGLRLDHRGRVHRAAPARALVPVLGVEGRRSRARSASPRSGAATISPSIGNAPGSSSARML